LLLTIFGFASALTWSQFHSDLDFKIQPPNIEIERFPESSESFISNQTRSFTRGYNVSEGDVIAEDHFASSSDITLHLIIAFERGIIDNPVKVQTASSKRVHVGMFAKRSFNVIKYQ